MRPRQVTAFATSSPEVLIFIVISFSFTSEHQNQVSIYSNQEHRGLSVSVMQKCFHLEDI